MVAGGASNTASRKASVQGVTRRWLQNLRKPEIGAKNTIAPNRSASFAAPNASTSLWPLTKPKPATSRRNRKSEGPFDRSGWGGGSVFRQPVKAPAPQPRFSRLTFRPDYTSFAEPKEIAM